MEGLRSEVSQKIKKAIQAKLIELGVTIDEELPDYIMVLVVNKKSKKQMEDDLFLFLQDKTVTFVEWLLEILCKLQSMSMQAKEKSAKSATKTSKNTVTKNEPRKRSSSGHLEGNNKSHLETLDQPPTKKRPAQPKPLPSEPKGSQSEVKGSADHVDSVHASALADSLANVGREAPPASDQRHSGEPSDPPRDARHSRRRKSRDSSRSRRSMSRGSSVSRASKSRESSKSRRSSSRDSSKSRRSASRDSSRSRQSTSRDSSESGRSASHDSSESRRSASRDSSKPRKPASRDPAGSRRSPESASRPTSDNQGGRPPGRRHPRISFPSDGGESGRRPATSSRERDQPSVDGEARRVPPPHGTTVPSGGRIINLREESSFAGRSRSRSPVRRDPERRQPVKTDGRRTPQSSVGAVRRPSPGEDEDAEDEDDRQRGVASAVRVTDRPRPPADLLPRPAILVKAMRDAQRSTGSGRREAGAEQRPHGSDSARPGHRAPAHGQRPFVGDLRSKLAESRRPAGLTVTVRRSPGR